MYLKLVSLCGVCKSTSSEEAVSLSRLLNIVGWLLLFTSFQREQKGPGEEKYF